MTELVDEGRNLLGATRTYRIVDFTPKEIRRHTLSTKESIFRVRRGLIESLIDVERDNTTELVCGEADQSH